jgi:catechol 2,3-dioxygenase-like lactoylglutathione lyase family enzyme
MFNAITHSQLYVLDQDEALDFYVGKLGLEVGADAKLEFMRWLTVKVPGDTHEIILFVPGRPLDEETAEEVRALLGKGALGTAIVTTDDCRATYEALRARGVEFTEEPVERFYGTDCALRDPFGNHIRITQPAVPMPAGPPSSSSEAATA